MKRIIEIFAILAVITCVSGCMSAQDEAQMEASVLSALEKGKYQLKTEDEQAKNELTLSFDKEGKVIALQKYTLKNRKKTAPVYDEDVWFSNLEIKSGKKAVLNLSHKLGNGKIAETEKININISDDGTLELKGDFEFYGFKKKEVYVD